MRRQHMPKRLWFFAALVACALGIALSLLALVNNPRTSAVIPAATATAAPLTTTIAAPSASATSALTGLPALLVDLPQAQNIHIIEKWNGMGYSTSRFDDVYQADFSLTRQGEQFTGIGQYSLSYGDIAQQTKQNVGVPADVVQSFLHILSNTAGEPGVYQPAIGSDNFPSVEIIISTINGSTRFYSQSASHDRVPWAMDAAGATYVVADATPQRAYDVLSPYLHWDVYDGLATKRNAAIFATQTAESMARSLTATVSPKR